MADFILVHGGLHGAWCWELLEVALKRLGHRSYAMDLPVDRPGATIDDYAGAALSHAASRASENAYLVGHSMGGLIVPRMIAARPGARIVFLCAGFAHTNDAERKENLAAIDDDLFFHRLKTDELGRVTMSRDDAIEAFYHDVPPERADWAVGKLRPQWAEGYSNVGPIAPYAEHVAGIVDCADDRIVLAEPHRRIAEARFGITPMLLAGGHSPFLSRPEELADMLNEIVRNDQPNR